MPRVTHVKAARKANPVAQVGESYYWWKFRFGGKRFSKTYPKRSQLTQSEYFGTLYDIDDQRAAISIDVSEYDVEGTTFEALLADAKSDAQAMLEEVQSAINDLAEECTERRDNMPDALQYSPTGELLEERSEACEAVSQEIDSAVSEIDSVEIEAVDPEDYEDADELREAQAEAFSNACEEIQTLINDIDIDQAVV